MISLATVWTIWRLLREYLEPAAGTLALHLWAVVAWLPLLTILNAERSLWIACIIPWAVANAIVVLNLWCALEELQPPPAHTKHPLFYVAPVLPLWRTLLHPCGADRLNTPAARYLLTPESRPSQLLAHPAHQ